MVRIMLEASALVSFPLHFRLICASDIPCADLSTACRHLVLLYLLLASSVLVPLIS